MKKFFVVLLLIAVCLTGVFAQEDYFELPEGRYSWIDENWDAEWVFDFDNVEVILKDAKKGDVIFTFNEDNITDFDYEILAGGAKLSFWCYCPATYRAYKFTSRYDFDINMVIAPDWTDEVYDTVIKMKD